MESEGAKYVRAREVQKASAMAQARVLPKLVCHQ